MRVVDDLFREKMREHTEEMAEETQDPIELDYLVEKVELELLEGQGTPAASTFNERRAVIRSLKGNVKVDEIFDLAEKNAETEAKRKILNAKDKQKHMYKHGNRVLVTGQA